MKQTLMRNDQNKFMLQIKVFFTIANQFELYATICNNFLKPFFTHPASPSDATLRDHAHITQTLMLMPIYVPNQVQDHILQKTLNTLRLQNEQNNRTGLTTSRTVLHHDPADNFATTRLEFFSRIHVTKGYQWYFSTINWKP